MHFAFGEIHFAFGEIYFALRDAFWILSLLNDVQNPPDGIAAGPVTEENFFEWEAAITGPEVSFQKKGPEVSLKKQDLRSLFKKNHRTWGQFSKPHQTLPNAHPTSDIRMQNNWDQVWHALLKWSLHYVLPFVIVRKRNKQNFFQSCFNDQGTYFEDGVFIAQLTFPQDYPLNPPKMK